ncbi:hypothetical protein EW145_g3667 [Phellinidium pouzarii]|uniref:Uncharacterized protein n=1 Tax=Phellinidium pouzarii TaxID=167371 RepID=A0A4S4L6J0_9AGAM|nr:hypothetical protein EW145_g3667 [Phellinidium pouzarii]
MAPVRRAYTRASLPLNLPPPLLVAAHRDSAFPAAFLILYGDPLRPFHPLHNVRLKASFKKTQSNSRAAALEPKGQSSGPSRLLCLPSYPRPLLPPAASPPVPAQAASSSKRKLDAHVDLDNSKRLKSVKHLPALGGAPTPSSSSPPLVDIPSIPNTARIQEVDVAPSTSIIAIAAGDTSSRSLTVYEPVRRPRHGIEGIDFRQLHKHYYQHARMFKYSGEARFLSTYPQSHSHHRPLRVSPPKGSPYHTHGGLMALLEALEALLCFVYAAWCQDHYSAGFNVAWETIPSYLHWCKGKWASYVGQRDSVREKSFIGLIHMIEAFTHQRIVRFKLGPSLDYKTNEYLHDIEVANARQASVKAESSRTTISKVTPPEKSLPSPDTDAASANSTPANPSNSTPTNTNGENRTEEAKRSGNKPLPSRPTEADRNPPDGVVQAKHSYIMSAKRLVSVQATASLEMKASEKTLSLAIMREHFPRTFGRMVCSTLSAEEEYEPDMEDGEGELFWPNQCVTGDGIGWVCLMGRAMVREFGKDIGYASVDAIIPKPSGAASVSGASG